MTGKNVWASDKPTTQYSPLEPLPDYDPLWVRVIRTILTYVLR